MKNLVAILCIAGSTLALAACETGNSGAYDSGASYATERTAGDVDAAPAPVQERVFREVQSK